MQVFNASGIKILETDDNEFGTSDNYFIQEKSNITINGITPYVWAPSGIFDPKFKDYQGYRPSITYPDGTKKQGPLFSIEKLKKGIANGAMARCPIITCKNTIGSFLRKEDAYKYLL